MKIFLLVDVGLDLLLDEGAHRLAEHLVLLAEAQVGRMRRPLTVLLRVLAAAASIPWTSSPSAM